MNLENKNDMNDANENDAVDDIIDRIAKNPFVLIVLLISSMAPILYLDMVEAVGVSIRIIDVFNAGASKGYMLAILAVHSAAILLNIILILIANLKKNITIPNQKLIRYFGSFLALANFLYIAFVFYEVYSISIGQNFVINLAVTGFIVMCVYLHYSYKFDLLITNETADETTDE